VCAGETVDHLIWHCERFRLERHRLIGALTALNVSIGIPIRDLCALKKRCAVKCCRNKHYGTSVRKKKIKMESILKRAILRLFIRPFEP
jgi:hypothetical protein